MAELADGIWVRAGRVAAGQAELLGWIAEFDRRQGWCGPGMLSCAHWLSWRIGLSSGTAREQVRVARRLQELPELAIAVGDGRVSYSKVWAITRVAEPADGVGWVGLARHSSAAQLDRIVRGLRRVRAVELAQTDPDLAQWKVRTRKHYDGDGNLVITITTRAQYAPIIEAGLDATRARLQRELDAEHARIATEPPAATPDVDLSAEPPVLVARDGQRPGGGVPAGTLTAQTIDDVELAAQAPGWPPGVTRRQVNDASRALADRWADTAPEQPDAPDAAPAPAAAAAPRVSAGTPERATVSDGDALLALAQDALAGEHAAHPGVARRRRLELTARIDPLSGWGRQGVSDRLCKGVTSTLGRLRAVLATLPGRGRPALRPVTEADLHRQDLGRTQRTVNDNLRELPATLDGQRCRFPGCTRRHRLHAHHVVFWTDGGLTDLANLVLVCSRHHTLIHTQGFQLRLHPDRQLSVTTADGIPVRHHPAQPWGNPAELPPDRGRPISAGTLPPEHCQARIDLSYIVSVVLAQAA